MTVDDLLAPLAFPFMQRALVGCVLVGLVCALIGVYVVLQHLSFVGQGLAQGALPGLALGFVLGVSLYLAALVVAVALALAIAFLRERGRVASDTAIAIAFSGAAALGVALISVVRFGPVDVQSYMFGNVLAIGAGDLVVLVLATVAVGAVLLGLHAQLAFAAFDPESAAAAGVPVRGLAYLFVVLVALVVVVSLQTVGLILVTAMLVVPAAAARQWVDRLPPMLILSALFGVGAAVVGLFTSYYLILPSGATIVLTVVGVFLVSWLARLSRDRLERQRAG